MHRKETDAGLCPSDADLMAAVVAGDQKALATLYDRHAPRLLALSQRLLSNAVDGEDLLHDLFIEVFHRAATYDPSRGSVLSWLVVRLRSRAIDRLRSPAYRRLVAISGDLPAFFDKAAASIEPSGGDPLTGALQEALQGLPQETQSILHLVYFKGMSLPEVATSMVLPLGTVKSRLHRALRSLRATVADPEERSA